MAAAIRTVIAGLWSRWWARAVVVGLTPPFVPAAPAHGAPLPDILPVEESAVDRILTEAVCEFLRASEMILRLPRAECPQISVSLGIDGWMWRITPIHMAWAVLAFGILLWAARRDWAGTTDSPAVRVGWEAAKTFGLAYMLKMAGSAMVGTVRDLAPAMELLR